MCTTDTGGKLGLSEGSETRLKSKLKELCPLPIFFWTEYLRKNPEGIEHE
jgi:hypothetical protein